MPDPHLNHCSGNKSGTRYKRVFMLIEAGAEIEDGRPRSSRSVVSYIHSYIEPRRGIITARVLVS